MAAIIKIENLYKIYSVGKEKVVALGGINLQIEKGQICCILGTSGSGKSTLLNQLAGLEKPSKGRVLIGGVNISTLNEGQLAKFRQKNIGFIFQSYNLLQSYSALENVAMPLMFRGIPKGLRNRWAKMILKQVTGQTNVPQTGADVGRSAAACGHCPRLCFQAEDCFCR